MKLPIQITSPPRRGFVFNRRTHHGLCGCVVVAVAALLPDKYAVARAAAAGLGAAMIAHDWPDRNLWLVDFMTHPARNGHGG